MFFCGTERPCSMGCLKEQYVPFANVSRTSTLFIVIFTVSTASMYCDFPVGNVRGTAVEMYCDAYPYKYRAS
jgi:hypothetical protein